MFCSMVFPPQWKSYGFSQEFPWMCPFPTFPTHLADSSAASHFLMAAWGPKVPFERDLWMRTVLQNIPLWPIQGFPQMRIPMYTPKQMASKGKNLLKLMIERSPHFRKPPIWTFFTFKKLEEFELVRSILLQQRVSFKSIEIRRSYAELAQGKTQCTRKGQTQNLARRARRPLCKLRGQHYQILGQT